jgi:type IV pilus assembly protein PilB
MQKKVIRLGEILLEKGLISAEQLKESLAEQKNSKEYLGKLLLRKKLINEKDLLTILSEQFGLAVVSLKNKYIDWNLVKRFSSSLILDYGCFPLKKDDRSVTFAITNPLDPWAIKKIEEEAGGVKLILVLVSQDDIREVIQRYQEYARENLANF